MKRTALYTIILVVCLCWGCSDEIQPQEPDFVGGTHVATLSVGTESRPDATKGTFVDDRTFQWQEGDQIGVYMYSTTLTNVTGSYGVSGEYGPWIAPFDIQSGAGTGTAVFSRELNGDLGECYGNVAVYPFTIDTEPAYHTSSYTYAADDTKGTLTFYLPSEYKDLEDLDMVRMPMAAVLDMDAEGAKKVFEFKHLGGAVKVTLQNVPAKAKYFKLTAAEGGNISGDFTISLADVGTGTLQGTGSGNTVQLSLQEGQAASELVMYFPVPAGTYKFKLSVYGDGITYLESYGGSTANTVGRGNILQMPAITIPEPNLGPYDENLAPSAKASGLTYQVNVYSFADSDGDGVGDFKGIENHLDYLDKLGVTALWLSPCQKAQSYHGYDVTDYSALNPQYGSGTHTSEQAETDFQSLISAAHQHNIRIYMDYVINHTGDQHAWFLDVKKNGPSSSYWNYYAVSADPYTDVHNDQIPQIPMSWDVDVSTDSRWWPLYYGAGRQAVRYAVDLDWTDASAPAITVYETTDAVSSGGTYENPARYLFWGDGQYTQFADNGTGKYRLVLDYQSDWGCLVRTTNDNNDWSAGTKWGFASGKDQMQLGVSHVLTAADSQNILMPDGTLYYYYSAFSTGMMPDLNYNHASVCEDSPAFQAVVASVDKWLDMGLDGLRLDAIKHIYGNESGGEGSENREFWQKFYSAVNAKYQAKSSARTGYPSGAVQDGNIFMVGEVLSNENDCRPFYACMPAIFEFQFWWDLRTALNSEDKGSFVSGLCDRFYSHRGVRSDAIATPKLSNHDEDRAASELGNYMPKKRLAAAVLLTSPGRPFIYQGEELGYWGTKSGGDEYVRAPILWESSISSAATGNAGAPDGAGKGLSGKYDPDMLTSSMSVASQAADSESLLMLYRRFAYARNTNPAMADGYPEYDNKTGSDQENCSNNSAIMAWYMHENSDFSGKTCLVMHNISAYTQTVTRWDGDNVSQETILVASDPIQVNGKDVTMPPYSSVVFALN